MTNSSSSNIQCEHIELIKRNSSHWEIVFNRPEKYNAITSDMYECLTNILDQAENDPDLVLLTMTGKGKFYSAGTDLSEPMKSFMTATTDIETSIDRGMVRLKNFIERFIKFPKILIAFINGPAIGIAVTILALFDGVYASSNATFSLPFTRNGLSPEGCSSFLFPSLMGSIQAKEILLFDRQLNAHEAQQRGLVTRVIDQKIFNEEKNKIIEHVLSLPRGSLLSSKSLLQKTVQANLFDVNQRELDYLKLRWTDEEFIEVISKFAGERTNKSKL